MLVLRLNDFYRELNHDGLSKRNTQEVVQDNVVINSSIVNWEHRIIKNIVFNKEVLIEEVDLKCGLSFEHCEFKEGIVFNKVIVSKYEESLFPHNGSLYFYECKSTKILVMNNSNIDRAICIHSNSDIDFFQIENSIIGNGGIRIKDSKINTEFDITASDIHSLAITNSVVDAKIRFETIKIKSSLSFIKSKFNDWVKFWNIDTVFGIVFNENTFLDVVSIKASRIKHGLYIHGDSFNKEFLVELFDKNEKIQLSSLEKVFIEEAKFIDRFIIDGKNNEIDELKLPMTSKLQGVIKFNECVFKSSELSGVNEHVKLIFKKTVFKSLKIEDFSNLSDVTFSNSKGSADGVLEIIDSDLGNTKFNEFSFKSFKTITIVNAFLNKIISTNIIWFDDKQLEVDRNSKNKGSEFYRNKREIYRQIKQALRSEGNQIDSLTFQAREMQAFRNELKSSGKNYKRSDKVIMTVSRTNNFGLSWWKPTWIIILITFGFYLFMLPLFSNEINYTIARSWNDVSKTLFELYNNFQVFWQLFNPTRRFTSTYGEIDSGWLQFLDLFQRMVLGIFIYQIITGFRRLTSK